MQKQPSIFEIDLACYFIKKAESLGVSKKAINKMKKKNKIAVKKLIKNK